MYSTEKQKKVYTAMFHGATVTSMAEYSKENYLFSGSQQGDVIV